MYDTLERLFRYKAWANDQLLASLASLNVDTAVTGLIIKALSHSHIVDRIFAAHLMRRRHAFASANASEVPTLEELAADIRKSDQEYLDFVSALDQGALGERIDFEFTDGTRGRMSREEMLMHVITHGVGHRGQISAVLLLNGLPPPRDGFTTYLHEAEASTRGRSTTA